MPKLTMAAARVNSGLTQEEMAQKMGISRSHYSDIENGKVQPKPVYIYGFCQITGLTPADIILPSRTT